MAVLVNSIVQAVLFFCLLLAVSVWDIRKRIIPDALSAFIFCTGLLTFTPSRLLGILLGLPLLIGALLADYRQMGGIGGGDIKLTAACGFVLGIPAGTAGLTLGLTAFCGSYATLKVFCKIRNLSQPSAGQTALPMAPFLSAGFITVYFINFGGLIL